MAEDRMVLVKEDLKDLEKDAKKGVRTIADFTEFEKKVKRLQRAVNKVLQTLRNDHVSLGLKLFYQGAARRLKEIHSQISYEVMKIPVTSKGYGFRKQRQKRVPTTTTKVVWQDVSRRDFFPILFICFFNVKDYLFSLKPPFKRDYARDW